MHENCESENEGFLKIIFINDNSNKICLNAYEFKTDFIGEIEKPSFKKIICDESNIDENNFCLLRRVKVKQLSKNKFAAIIYQYQNYFIKI